MPSAPFDQFQRLDKSIMREGDDHAARDRWDRLGAELIGRPEVSKIVAMLSDVRADAWRVLTLLHAF